MSTRQKCGLTLVAWLAATLGSGCGGGADFISSLFGDSTALEIAGSSSGAFSSGGGLLGFGGGGSPDGGVGSDVINGVSQGSVVNPEPASVALFGGGLIGISYLRRRNNKRRRRSI